AARAQDLEVSYSLRLPHAPANLLVANYLASIVVNYISWLYNLIHDWSLHCQKRPANFLCLPLARPFSRESPTTPFENFSTTCLPSRTALNRFGAISARGSAFPVHSTTS